MGNQLDSKSILTELKHFVVSFNAFLSAVFFFHVHHFMNDSIIKCLLHKVMGKINNSKSILTELNFW